MASNKDVRLVIRAKNDASKTFEEVSDAIKSFADIATGASGSVNRFSDYISKLTTQGRQLASQLSGLQALSKINTSLSEASAAVAKMGEALKASKAELESLKQQYSDASAKVAELKKASDNLVESQLKQSQAAKTLKKDLADSNRELRAAKKAYEDVSKSATNRNNSASVAEAAAQSAITAKHSMELAADGVAKATEQYSAYAAAVRDAKADLRETNKAAVAAKNALKAFNDAADTPKPTTSTSKFVDLTTLQANLINAQEAVGRAKSVLAGLTDEQTRSKRAMQEANSVLREATRRYEELKAAAAKGAQGGTFTNAADSAKVFAKAELDRATAAAAEASAKYDTLRDKISTTKDEISVMNAALKEAISQETSLSNAVDKSSLAYDRQAASYEKMSNELKSIATISNEVGAALGKAGASQEELAKATANANSALEKTAELQAAMKRFSTGDGGFSDPKSAAAIRAQRAEVEKARDAYNILNAELNRLKQSMSGAVQSTEAETNALREMKLATAQAKAELDRQIAALNRLPEAANRANGVRGLFSGIYGESRQAMSLLQRIRGEILSITAAYVGLFAVMNQITGVIDAYRKLEAAQNRISIVMGQNQQATASELSFVSRTAQRLGMDMGVLADEYSKFAVSAKIAGFEMSSIRKIFTSVAEASRVNKNTMEQTQGIFLALTQMISKGKVASEELRRQMGDRMAGAFDLFAKSLGVTSAELDKLMREGKVLADEKTMVGFAKILSDTFGAQLPDSLRTLTTHLGNFQNQLFQIRLLVADGGFAKALISLLDDLNDKLSSREGRDFFLAIGSAAGSAVDAIKFLINHLGLLVQMLNVIISVKIVQWMTGLYKSFTDATGRIAQFRAALTGLVANMAAAGSAMGALRVAATALGAAFKAIWPMLVIGVGVEIFLTIIEKITAGVPKATEALDEHQRILQKVLTAYDQLGRNSNKEITFADVKGAVPLEEADRNFINLQEQYNKALEGWRHIGGIGDALAEPFKNMGTVIRGNGAEFVKLRNIVMDTNKPLEDVVKELRELANNSVDGNIKKQALAFLENTEQTLKLKDSLIEAAKVAKGLGSASEEVTKILGDQAVSLDELGKARETEMDKQEAAQKSLEKYHSAIDKLRESIPALAKEAKNANKALAIDNSYKEALDGINNSLMTGVARFQAYIKASALWASARHELKIDTADDTFLAERRQGGPAANSTADVVRAAAQLAGAIGAATEDILTVMQYESGGVWNKYGGYNKQYYGLLQFGPNERKTYGMPENAGVWEQLPAWIKFFKDRGFKPGMSFADLYSTINAGSPGRYNASDVAKGGKNTSVAAAVASKDMDDARRLAKSQYDTWKDIAESDYKHAEALRRGNEATEKTIQKGRDRLAQEDLLLAGKEKEAFIEDKVADAKRENANIDEKQIAIIRDQAAQEWDKKKALDEQKKEKTEIQKLEDSISKMQERRSIIEERRGEYARRGDSKGVQRMDAEVVKLNIELQHAIDKAIQYYKTHDSPEAQTAIEKLETLKLKIQDVGQVALWSGEQITNIGAGSATNSIESFFRAWRDGEKSIKDVWEIFSAFASDFLIQIGRMIVQASLFRLFAPLGGWIAGGMNSLMSTMHTGGIVTKTLQNPRVVNPAVFASPLFYHEGGFAGLRPHEVPAILKENEEVLTTSDPRHAFNGGKNKTATAGNQSNVKIVNLFDSTDVVTEALKTPAGQQVILNVVKRNKTAIKSALG